MQKMLVVEIVGWWDYEWLAYFIYLSDFSPMHI